MLPGLVELGVVERHEVPPASLFRLVTEHVAARALLGLARSGDAVMVEVGEITRRLPQPPASVIVFGSFARRQAGIDSDIDVVVVRPSGVSEDDDGWSESMEQWRSEVRRLTGNPVDVLEISVEEAAERLASGATVWADIRRDGQVVHGLSVEELLRSPQRG